MKLCTSKKLFEYKSDKFDKDVIEDIGHSVVTTPGHGATFRLMPHDAPVDDVAWGMEGDTPSFLGLIQNGLNVPDKPNYGGWGGRYELGVPDINTMKDGGSIVVPEPETRPIWTNASDAFTPYVHGEYKRAVKKSEKSFTGNHVTLWRWREDQVVSKEHTAPSRLLSRHRSINQPADVSTGNPIR